MQKHSSVFFGTPDFALRSLEAAIKCTNVLAVVTQPDRPRGRGQKLSPCPVKALALANGIRCFSPSSLRKSSDDLDVLKNWMSTNERPDFLLVTAYGNILPQSFLDWPKIGPINVHASLLPRWRGAAPIQRALEAGDTTTGVSLQKMVFELDAGNVLAEETQIIASDMNAQTLSEHLSGMGGMLLEKFLHSFSEERFMGVPQNPNLISFAKKIEKEEGYFSSNWTAEELHNRVRAFSVWPGVKADFKGSTIKLVETTIPQLGPELNSPLSLPLGSLSMLNNAVYLTSCKNIRTGERSLVELKKVQFQGKPATLAIDALRNSLSSKETFALAAPKI